jgi:hypothetical protein
MPAASYYRFRTEWGGLKYAYARMWPQRSSIVPAYVGAYYKPKPSSSAMMSGQAKDEISAQLHQWAHDLDDVKRRLPAGLNSLARILAMYDARESVEMSRGPMDRGQRQPGLAWKIPVRRISSHYYQGWRVRRVRNGVWMVYNPTREAYYIEYGIHTSNRRVRRPVRKLALLRTLRWADRNGVGGFVWEGIFGHLRRSGLGARGAPSTSVMPQSPPVMPFMGGGM